MTTKTYTVVGTSVRGGKRKLRLSNGDAITRGHVLFSTGNTEIVLYDLPSAMTKYQAESAYDELFRKRTCPAYSSPDFNYDTIGRTPRPESELVDRAVKYIEEMK